MSSETFLGYFIVFLFFALPVAAVVWFLVSLVGFFRARGQREAQPDRFKSWRRSLIASAIAAFILVGLCLGILVLLVAAVAHM